MEIRAHTQSEAWVRVVLGLLSAPVVAPRGLRVREAAERVSVVISRPQDGFVRAEGRTLNHTITVLEGAALVGQVSVPEILTDKVKAFLPFANDGVFWGAYGPRAAGDVGLVVDLLRRDPDSRQAVITLFDSDRDLGRPEVKDVPCTLNVQFFLRDDYVSPGESFEMTPYANLDKYLHIWVTMRSNDAWLGLPYDLGQFSMLQFAVAQALGARVGSYTHSVGSMHLYERNWAEAEQVGHPSPVRVGHSFGAHDIETIAARCRRILLGHEITLATSLEHWMREQLA